jgi:hypothetical protein
MEKRISDSKTRNRSLDTNYKEIKTNRNMARHDVQENQKDEDAIPADDSKKQLDKLKSRMMLQAPQNHLNQTNRNQQEEMKTNR